MADGMDIKVQAIKDYIARRKADVAKAEQQIYGLEKLLSDLGYGPLIDPPEEPEPLEEI